MESESFVLLHIGELQLWGSDGMEDAHNAVLRDLETCESQWIVKSSHTRVSLSGFKVSCCLC